MPADPEILIDELEDAEPIEQAAIAEAEQALARILFDAFLEHVGAGRPAARATA